ncbi:MAG: hypothetical protein JSW34_02085 [Candidatus Zixiibacteriota bacterium]|nr:MAG: hypothetical protein JSW34_02085 [candidate division Zixibacteria bacterium]
MSRPGEIVRAFLHDPCRRGNFNPFFALAHSTAVGFLRYYHGRGYQLPLHQADQEAAYSDLAVTLLGDLFRSQSRKPFAPVVDYFERHSLEEGRSVSDAELFRHFKTLICGYVKKQLFRLRKTENSQAENLKRRMKDILRPPTFIRIESGYNEPSRVALAKWRDNLRADAPPVSFDRLRQIVQRAYVQSLSRTEWCQKIFELLNAEDDTRNFVYLNDLLTIMVSTNAEALQEMLPPLYRPASPETESMRRSVDCLVDQTVGWAEQNVIAEFILKGRLAACEGRAYCRALENYLLDLSYCGDTDSIPQYFREVTPADQHGSYLARHKYTFETVISASVKYFREKLKEKST